MNINEFMAKLVIEKTKDESFSHTGKPDFEASMADVTDLKPLVRPARQNKVNSNSY